MRNRPPTGFTLIELAIVMVIIGLIIGGVMVGRDLVYAATIRKVITEEAQLQTAYTTFKNTYNCIPGDCANATSFFGQASDCTGNTTLNGGACNGNGDAVICGPSETSCQANVGEHMWAAYDLVLAGYVSLPLTAPGNNQLQIVAGYPVTLPGQNTFGSRAFSGIGWAFGSMASFEISTSSPPLTSYCGNFTSDVNILFFGAAAIQGPRLGMNNAIVSGAAKLTGQVAYDIDTKIDDGLRGGGWVQAPGIM